MNFGTRDTLPLNSLHAKISRVSLSRLIFTPVSNYLFMPIVNYERKTNDLSILFSYDENLKNFQISNPRRRVLFERSRSECSVNNFLILFWIIDFNEYESLELVSFLNTERSCAHLIRPITLIFSRFLSGSYVLVSLLATIILILTDSICIICSLCSINFIRSLEWIESIYIKLLRERRIN